MLNLSLSLSLAAYAASVLFCLSEDGRKSAQTATIFRNEVCKNNININFNRQKRSFLSTTLTYSTRVDR